MSDRNSSNVTSVPLLIFPERKLFSISQGVDEDCLQHVMNALGQFKPEDRITLLLATQGGDVECGLAIYDLLKAHPGGVRIVGTGYVYSMGSIILQAGTERLLLPHTSLMVHWGNQATEDDNPENFRRKLKFSEKLDDACNVILLERMRAVNPKLMKGTLKRRTANDWYLSAEEAVAQGLADAVISSPFF